MNENYQLQFEGVTYYIQGTEIVDIDVKPGINRVCFKSFKDYCNRIISVNIKSDKSYPDVEELYIRAGIKNIDIKNQLFPNINKILSSALEFKNDTNMLIKVDYGYKNILLNTFCKKQNEEIDLHGVGEIAPSALDGCDTTNVVNTQTINIDNLDIFAHCSLATDERSGAKMFGDIMVEPNKEAEIVEIPDYSCYELRVFDKLEFSSKNKAVKIHCYSTLKKLIHINLPPKLIIENNSIGASTLPIFLKDMNIEYIEVKDDQAAYKTIDGILYSKDGKILIRCPRNRKGSIVIPEGVVCIDAKAFNGCQRVQSVIMPESLKSIQNSAFKCCERLSNVCLNKNLMYIGNECFAGCSSLTSIDIPDNIPAIGDGCFHGCHLKNIKLPKNLMYIGVEAFDYAGGEIVLPESLQEIEEYNFSNADVIKVANKIPSGLLTAIMSRYNNDGCNIIEICTPDDSIYMPQVKYSHSIYELLSLSLPLCDIRELLPSLYKDMLATMEPLRRAKIEMLLYEKTKDSGIKKELKHDAVSYARRLINQNNESELIRLIKCDVMSRKQLEILMERIQRNNMPTAAAYVLDYINSKSLNCDEGQDFDI